MYAHSEIKNYQIKTNRNEAINSTRKKMDFLYQNIQSLNEEFNNIKEEYTIIRDSLVQLNHRKENESSITSTNYKSPSKKRNIILKKLSSSKKNIVQNNKKAVTLKVELNYNKTYFRGVKK